MRFTDLEPDLQRELRRIREELEAFPFVERTWLDRDGEYAREGGYGCGRGARHSRPQHSDDCPFADGAGGAPVFHDIDPKGSARRDIFRTLLRFEQGRTATAIVLRAIEVARLRLDGDGSVSRPILPPYAGDLAALDAETIARAQSRDFSKRHTAAQRAWVTIRAHRHATGPKSPHKSFSADSDRASRLSLAAKKAWATRRARLAEAA